MTESTPALGAPPASLDLRRDSNEDVRFVPAGMMSRSAGSARSLGSFVRQAAPNKIEARPSPTRSATGHVLILVENLPVPFDRRVWQEALALKAAGYDVSVICPKGKGCDASFEVLNGVEIYRHRLVEARRALYYPIEYALALTHQLHLSMRVRMKRRIDVIQACNPPDLLFLVALVHKVLFGTRFVFDHHDLNPELYACRFGRRDLIHRALLFFERRTFRLADASISTNEVFREIAIDRGGMSPDRVFVVKSYPDARRFERVEPDAELVARGKHIIGYVGIMGAQDGVDMLIRAMAELVHVRKRRDVLCVIVGDGPEYESLQALAKSLDLGDAVEFTGYLRGAPLMSRLSAFEIGVIPDPPNDFNRKLSMNKVFEYMMLGLAFVQFDLTQARSEAGGAALVAAEHTPEALADGIVTLIDDPSVRSRMGKLGIDKAGRDFRWSVETARYLAAYESVLSDRRSVHDQRHHTPSQSA